LRIEVKSVKEPAGGKDERCADRRGGIWGCDGMEGSDVRGLRAIQQSRRGLYFGMEGWEKTFLCLEKLSVLVKEHLRLTD